MDGQELESNYKGNQSEPLQNLYCGLFYDILNGVLMGIFQLLWLLRSGKVVGYKVEMCIPNTWILKGGEVLANECC